MKKELLKTDHSDPLNVLSSTRRVLKKSGSVSINPDKIGEIRGLIKNRIKEGFGLPEEGFGSAGSLEDDIQLIFFENVVNFCFWSGEGEAKWQVEYPRGETKGGWFGLKKSFERALEEGIPILDPEYLANLKIGQLEYIFRSATEKSVPLIEERLRNLREAGSLLLEKYNGKFFNLLEEADFSAPEITKKIYRNFPSFKDFFDFQGKKVYFLKRAQICAYDLSYLRLTYGLKSKIKDLDQLTVFADYKLPQLLRAFGVISYSQDLANKVDNYILIQEGSKQEMEIRASTIWACELIRQEMPEFNNGLIDNALWYLGSELKPDDLKPHHRTESIYY
jgi:hypothetical protein